MLMVWNIIICICRMW